MALDPLSRNQANAAAKRILDELLKGQISSLAIGPGWRTIQMCSELTKGKDSSTPSYVVTNSVEIQRTFSENTSTDIWLVGGKFHRDSKSLVPSTNRNAFGDLGINCDVAVLAVEGITIDDDEVVKFYVPYQDELPTLRGLCSCALTELIVLVHRFKIKKHGVAGFAVANAWEALRNRKLTIVTNEPDPVEPDSPETEEVLTWLGERGCVVVEAARK